MSGYDLGTKCWACLHPRVSSTFYEAQVMWVGEDTAIVRIDALNSHFEVRYEHMKPWQELPTQKQLENMRR